MEKKVDLRDIDIASFEEKVYVFADEVLEILKELSRENQKQISTKFLAERMSRKDSVKNLLIPQANKQAIKPLESEQLKTAINLFFDKLMNVVPSNMMEEFSNVKICLNDNNILKSADWIDSPIKAIKKHINSVYQKNKELEELLFQTMKQLGDTEKYMYGELSSQKIKFKDDRNFEADISENIQMIAEESSGTNNFKDIRTAVMKRIEKINRGIENRKQEDMIRLSHTEKTISEMKKRMDEIKREADDIRKRSQEAEFESYHDALTGLYNRRAYDDKIKETLANLERYKVPASLMVCDIDFFKKINDNFGHNVGDLALKKLAEFLVERLRQNDFIARYGGEEFIIILPHTDIKGALIAGDGIRTYIAKSIFSYKNQPIPLTVSIGISCFKNGDDAGTVFERADRALYLAKKTGRNRVKTEDDLVKEASVLNQN